MKLKNLLAATLLSSTLWATQAVAEEPKPTQELTKEEIAEMINNPLSYLWMMGLQNDTFYYDGDIPGADKIKVNRLMLMPVMPFQLTDDIKVVARPWLPIMSIDRPRNRSDFNFGLPDYPYIPTGVADTSWNSGIGDAGLWLAFASNEGAKPPFVWGFGITSMFDTASSEEYGTGYNSAGPMGLAFYIGEKWIAGGVLQHWWDYSGSGTAINHNGLSLTDFQPVIRYRLTPETNIGMAPNIQYNWKTEDWNVPLGLGMDTMINIGPLPVKIGFEAYYYVKHGPDDFHNDWQLRLFFVPVLPSPDWSRKALF